MHGDALEDVALRLGRDADNRERLAAIECRARISERVGTHHDPHCAARIQRLDDPAADLAEVAIDDGNRNLAEKLGQVGLGIIDAIEYWSTDHQNKCAAD